MLENRALEIIVIALVVLVLFGAKRLPDSARALGKSLRILKAETRALREEEPVTPAAPASATAESSGSAAAEEGRAPLTATVGQAQEQAQRAQRVHAG